MRCRKLGYWLFVVVISISLIFNAYPVYANPVVVTFDYPDVSQVLGYVPTTYLIGIDLKDVSNDGGNIIFAWKHSRNRGIDERQRKENIKFFLLALAIPDTQLWVNLNVNLNDLQVIGHELLYTDIGKVLMYSDVKLKEDVKQLSQELGIWDDLLDYGASIAPEKDNWQFDPRFWIVPGEIESFMSRTGFCIKNATFDVKFQIHTPADADEYQKKFDRYAEGLIKEKLLPRLIELVNSDVKYTLLRQVYNACIIAQWYKKFARDKIDFAFSELADSGEIDGLQSTSHWTPREYLDQYVIMYKRSLWDSYGDDWQFYGGGIVLDTKQRLKPKEVPDVEETFEFLAQNPAQNEKIDKTAPQYSPDKGRQTIEEKRKAEIKPTLKGLAGLVLIASAAGLYYLFGMPMPAVAGGDVYKIAYEIKQLLDLHKDIIFVDLLRGERFVITIDVEFPDITGDLFLGRLQRKAILKDVMNWNGHRIYVYKLPPLTSGEAAYFTQERVNGKDLDIAYNFLKSAGFVKEEPMPTALIWAGLGVSTGTLLAYYIYSLLEKRKDKGNNIGSVDVVFEPGMGRLLASIESKGEELEEVVEVKRLTEVFSEDELGEVKSAIIDFVKEEKGLNGLVSDRDIDVVFSSVGLYEIEEVAFDLFGYNDRDNIALYKGLFEAILGKGNPEYYNAIYGRGFMSEEDLKNAAILAFLHEVFERKFRKDPGLLDRYLQGKSLSERAKAILEKGPEDIHYKVRAFVANEFPSYNKVLTAYVKANRKWDKLIQKERKEFEEDLKGVSGVKEVSVSEEAKGLYYELTLAFSDNDRGAVEEALENYLAVDDVRAVMDDVDTIMQKIVSADAKTVMLAEVLTEKNILSSQEKDSSQGGGIIQEFKYYARQRALRLDTKIGLFFKEIFKLRDNLYQMSGEEAQRPGPKGGIIFYSIIF